MRDERVNPANQFAHIAEGAATDRTLGDEAKPPFHLVQPGRVGRREMQMEARAMSEPRFHFSVRLDARFPDAKEARFLLRIFLFHEYLHVVHGITKASFEEVGKFANGLERADYMCDLYGVLHELDWETDEDPTLANDFDHYRRRLGDLIDLVLRTFWSFEPDAPLGILTNPSPLRRETSPSSPLQTVSFPLKGVVAC